MSDEIAKQKIKQNLLLDYSRRLVQFIEHNRGNLLKGLAGLGVAAVILIVMSQNAKATRQKAMEAFEGALSYYNNILYQSQNSTNFGTEEKASLLNNAVARFQSVADEYPSTDLAQRALVYEGNAYYSLGNHMLALQKYREGWEKGQRWFLAPFILISMGNCYEEMGQYQAAADQYLKVRDKFPKSPLCSRVYIDAGRCYEALNNYTAAREAYEKVANFYPETPWAEYGSKRVAWLTLQKKL